MATKLGDMAVGSTVKIKVNGTLTDFLIVQQGKPSSIYNDSCNGTWLLMKYIYGTGSRDAINSYLNSTFLNQIDADIRKEIKQVMLPDAGGNMFAKIFLLSATETSIKFSYTASGEGAVLVYFEGCNYTGADSTRVAYFGSSAYAWWLRSLDRVNDGWALYVDKHGGCGDSSSFTSYGIRPALILPSTLFVLDDGTITENQPPEVTSDSGATGTELGEKNAPFTVGYTVTDKDGDLMTVTEKLDGEVKQTRTEVPSETALTVDWLKEKAGYQQVLNGAHTLTLTVSDGKTSVDWTATFTKNVTSAVLSLAQPLTADDTITVAALTLEGSFPADMSLSVEMTNNARDDAPVWENCTDIQRGESRAFVHHAFTNKTAAKGAAFNYKVTITRGKSGVGGNITMIGGVIG